MSKEGHLVTTSRWPGLYEDDNGFENPYQTKSVLVENLLRKPPRPVPGNPATRHISETVTFTIQFYEAFAAKFVIKYARHSRWPLDGLQDATLEPEAPHDLDCECVWVIRSGQAIAKPMLQAVGLLAERAAP